MVEFDITAISGICGSISIACWLVVFSPQIFENFRRSSADGLSVQFIIVWLSGDVCNVLGSLVQGVLPTMLILAVYYMICDICLLCQCFFYKGFTWRDTITPPAQSKNTASSSGQPTEHTSLLVPNATSGDVEHSVSASHLSPAVPLLPDLDSKTSSTSKPAKFVDAKPRPMITRIFLNLLAILVVVSFGILGWYLTSSASENHPKHNKGKKEEEIRFSPIGQTFGYFCACLYLSSRVPQLLLNFRRKSTEGVSMLFFMFACIGNFTYVSSILFYDSKLHCTGNKGRCGNGEAQRLYWRYIAVNASWLAGSAGTLMLDAVIFTQFWLYRGRSANAGEVEHIHSVVGNGEVEREVDRDMRPLLERGDSTY